MSFKQPFSHPTFQKIMNELESQRPSLLLYTLPDYRQLLEFFYEESLSDSFLSWCLQSLSEHDKSTYLHSLDVAFLSFAFSRAFKTDEPDIFPVSGLVHDIGKLFISPDILQSSEPLSDAEWLTIQNHPRWGYDFLKQNRHLQMNAYSHLSVNDAVCLLTLCHHEHPNGIGYPQQLKGVDYNANFLAIRIIDELSALTLDRYRKGMSPEVAIDVLLSNLQKDGHYQLPTSYKDKIHLLFSTDKKKRGELERYILLIFNQKEPIH